MKNFTKAALIITLVLVILGSAFCAIGIGIGFSFPEFWREVEWGKYSIGPFARIPFERQESTYTEAKIEDAAESFADYAEQQAEEAGDRIDDAAEAWADYIEQQAEDEVEQEAVDEEAMEGTGDTASESTHFPWESVKNIEVEAYYGSIVLQESRQENQDEIFVHTEYPVTDDSRGTVRMYMEGDTLHVKEAKKNAKRILRKEEASINIEIPVQVMDRLWLEKIELKQENGTICIDTPLTAEEIKIKVEKGECNALAGLMAAKGIEVEVVAGNGYFEGLESESLDAECDMGNMTVARVSAEKVSMECGMGALELHVVGKESDYSYDLECGVGTIEVGGSSYSGLAGKKEIKNSGSKKMDVECGMGTINVHFSET